MTATRHAEDLKASSLKSTSTLAQSQSGSNAQGTPPLENAYDEQALIEEARQRQRRRRQLIGAIFAVVLAVAAIGAKFGFGGGSAAPTTENGSGPLPVAKSSNPAPPTLDQPEAVAATPNGNVLISNQGTNQILQRMQSGKFQVVAGSGIAGFHGDGGPAVRAELREPGGMAVSSNGTIYVADTGNNRIRKIAPSGIIRTFAGTGQIGMKGVGGPAVRGDIAAPVTVALGNQGQLYVADDAGIQVISPKGILSTWLKAGPAMISIHGALTAFFPSAVAIGHGGDVFVADSSPKLLVEFTSTGRLIRSWPIYVTTAGLSSGTSGSVLIADYGGFSIDQILNGNLTILQQFGLNSLTGVPGVFRPSGVAANSSNNVFATTDGINGGTNRSAVVEVTSTGTTKVIDTGRSASLTQSHNR